MQQRSAASIRAASRSAYIVYNLPYALSRVGTLIVSLSVSADDILNT